MESHFASCASTHYMSAHKSEKEKVLREGVDWVITVQMEGGNGGKGAG